MEANAHPLTAIFRKDVRYDVPMFQRPYVWNEEEHWRLLWEDLVRVVQDLINIRSDASNDSRQTPDIPPHFLGAMVFEQVSTPTGKIDVRQVIDGQQRLITLQLLLAAGQEIAQEIELGKQVTYFQRLMLNDPEVIEDPEFRVKVWPIEPDRDAFLRVVAPELMNGGDQFAQDGSHRITEAFTYFRDAIRDWVRQGDEEVDQQERVDALTTTLWEHLRIVVIDLDEGDDPQVIFETLNARGTPLLHADLIKNHIFREAQKQGLRVARLHETYWQQFDEEEWRETITQGRLSRPKIDVLVMHWLTMRTAEMVRAQKLFPEFQRRLALSDESVKDWLADLAHYAEVYESLSDGRALGREGLFFSRLDVMDTTTPIPVLLWMVGTDGIDSQDRDGAIWALESWLIRRMLCRETPKNYNRILLDLLQRLKQALGRESLTTSVVGFLREKEGPSDYWPDDEAVEHHVTHTPYWSRINQRRLRMIFRALEGELRSTGFSEEPSLSASLHIEHILPQDWAHHWPLPGDEPPEVERINRDKAKHLMGNLTVVTDRLNPSISNAAWPSKREELKKYSVLLLNRELVENYPDRWDENTIKDRGRRLAQLISRVWPGPDFQDWRPSR